MDKSERELKNHLSEALFRIDELESHLESITKEVLLKDKQIDEQNVTIQQLRDKSYKSVEFNEYEVLKEKLEKISLTLIESQNKNEFLNKRLNTELEEIELLHNKNDLQLIEMNKLKKSLNKCKNIVQKQNIIIEEMNETKKTCNYYKKELEKVLIENSELCELIDIYREDLKHNESNISVEDLNQSISKFWDSINGNNGESMDCVIDIKLSDVERALEEKERLNQELQNRMKVMNEEIKQLNQLRIRFENRDEDMKIHFNQIQIELKPNEKSMRVKSTSIAIKEKESFDKIFGLIEKRFLSYIPLNGYFVPFGKRLIFLFTPKFLIRLFICRD